MTLPTRERILRETGKQILKALKESRETLDLKGKRENLKMAMDYLKMTASTRGDTQEDPVAKRIQEILGVATVNKDNGQDTDDDGSDGDDITAE